MSDTMRLIARDPIQYTRQRYEPGSELEVPADVAAGLLASGAADQVPAVQSSDPDPDRAEAIRAAIATLEPGNEDHWTKGGKPEVRALEATTGLKNISAAERDRVWADITRTDE